MRYIKQAAFHIPGIFPIKVNQFLHVIHISTHHNLFNKGQIDEWLSGTNNPNHHGKEPKQGYIDRALQGDKESNSLVEVSAVCGVEWIFSLHV